MLDSKSHKNSDHTKRPAPAKPVWPLPMLLDQEPILLIFDPADPGVEVTYELLPEGDSGPMVRSAQNDNTGRMFIPSFTPVFAVHDGVIVYAAKHEDGYAITIDHENGWMSFYGKLQQMFTAPTDRRPPRTPAPVRTGDVLGYVGSAAQGTCTLRFELWKQDRGEDYISVDPIRHMRTWRVLPWNDKRFKTAAATTTAAARAA